MVQELTTTIINKMDHVKKYLIIKLYDPFHVEANIIYYAASMEANKKYYNICQWKPTKTKKYIYYKNKSINRVSKVI